MITITFDCSYHQVERSEPKQESITLETIDDETLRKKMIKYLEAKGWVVQLNGNNMDTYCTKTCAK